MCSLFTSRSDIHCKELDPVPVPFNTSCCILRLCSHTVTVILSSKQLQLLLSQVSPSSRFVSATDMTDFGFASALTGLVNGWKWSSPIAVSVQNPVQISVHSPVQSPESRFCTNPCSHSFFDCSGYLVDPRYSGVRSTLFVWIYLTVAVDAVHENCHG